MNEQGLYEIYGTWHVPFWQTTLFIASMVSLFLLIITILAYFLLKKYFFKSKPLSPEQEALLALEKLKNRKIVTEKEGQAIYFEVTFLLKTYIYKSLNYDVISLTDREMVDFLQQHYFPAHALQHLKDICSRSLYIKFAQDTALHDQILNDLEKSVAIVQRVQEHLQLQEK